MATPADFIAIAGNPNAGKTTAFNWYTGSRQHVGNYPGITVEKKAGTAQVEGRAVSLVDLPGTYSLSAYSLEEVVARRVLAEERPGAVLNVVNAGVLERNLYLTVQMLEMGVPVVLALNMMDEAKAQGIHIDVEQLKALTGLTAVPTVARQGDGLDEALRETLALADRCRGRTEPLVISYGPDIDAALKDMTPMVESAKLLADKYPARWVALKYLERDDDVISQGRAADAACSDALAAAADKVSAHIKATLNSYPEALIADYRYGYIASILKQGVLCGDDDLKDRIAYSDKMDVVLTHRVFGPLIMLGILYLMYFITFTMGEYPAEWLGAGFEWLRETVAAAMNDGMLKSLVTSGIIDGVGGVLGFVPLIAIMFLLIAFLEDSGYMARVAYMLDRVFRIFGLHGASVMPFIISGGIAGGCAVPGVMATRTLRSPRERLATMLTAPFMACGAKLPVFLLIVGVFFEKHQALIMILLSLAGWAAALLVARLLRSTVIRGEATPFVMELPPYRLPTLAGILIHTWERAWQYIKKAGTVILAISVLIWASMTFPGLPDDLAARFEAEKAPLEEALASYPYAEYSAMLAELERTLDEAGSGAPGRAGLDLRADAVRRQLQETPAGRLEAEIAELQAQLEKLPRDKRAEELRAEMEGHAAALAELPDDAAGAESLRERLAALEAAYGETPAGIVGALIEEKEEALSALPEKVLEGKIAALENEAAGLALRHSYAGRVGIALEVVTEPAGFDWRTNIALIGGIAAKEVVVATLGTAYSLGEVDEDDSASTLADRIRSDAGWTKANAVALLLFTLLYSPCFVTLAVIKQESGRWGWLWFSLFFNLGLAYGVAVAANQLILRL